MSEPARVATPTLTTERLMLRAVQHEDLDIYHARIFADPDVMRYLPGGEPMPRERLDGVVERSDEHWERHGYGVWIVCELATGELIGQCGLRYLDEVSETEVLYALARSFWGRGIATEATRAALQFAFEEAGRDRVIALAVPENIASRKVMEHVGMQYEAETRMFDLDLVQYAVDRDNFRSGADRPPSR